MSILEAIPVVAEFFASEESRSDSWRSGLHSGNIGDVLYSLPTCRMLGIDHFILNVCADPAFGGRALSEQAARALAPLLLAQKFIRRVTVIKSGVPWEYASPKDLGVDYILDSFRATFTNPRLHLLYAHAVPFNLMVDGAQPWITIDQADRDQRITQEPYIVVALTNRYRRLDHAYYEHLLRDVPADRVFFVGVGSDQIERRNIGGTVFQTSNFADLARLLANAALFIGNPSFAYALAEGLKVDRFVEVPEDNNVYPLDGSGSLLHMTAPEVVRKKIFDVLQLQDTVRLPLENPIPGYILANMPFVQLFFDSGSGFNEIESIPKPVVRGTHQYTFDTFPQGASIRSFRIDPINDHVVVRINRVKVVGEAAEQVLGATPLNATYTDGSECYFAHGDPQFLLDIPDQFQNELRTLVVDMDILAVGPIECANSLYTNHFEKLASERNRLASELGGEAARYDQLSKERDALATERNQLAAERARLVSGRDQWILEREQLMLDREQLAAEKGRLLAERTEIFQSRSWRLTAPIRWFVSLFAA